MSPPRCAECEIPLRTDLPFYRDIVHHVELCVKCAQTQILTRLGLEYVSVFRGVRA